MDDNTRGFLNQSKKWVILFWICVRVHRLNFILLMNQRNGANKMTAEYESSMNYPIE